ncbi:MAG TPA: hypothetical protein VGB55_03580 [Tepidisphaeraceae bacterium]|jgi:hypothetical protein
MKNQLISAAAIVAMTCVGAGCSFDRQDDNVQTSPQSVDNPSNRGRGGPENTRSESEYQGGGTPGSSGTGGSAGSVGGTGTGVTGK